MSTPTPPPSRRELEAEVLRTRADLAAAIDELTTRLSPGYQASRIAREAEQAARDAGTMVAGMFGNKNGPAQDPRRARNAKVVLIGTTLVVALGTVVVVTAVLRRARG